jgi:acyl carrier protein
LQELEALGAETLVLSADVADREQMQDVIAQAEERFGQINGVIHAAGVVDYAGIIQRRSRETTETVLAPKVKGTLILDALFSGVQLDFLVLCSTLGTLLPWAKFGEVGYCAANEFLDAFSYYKTLSKNSQFTVTINWTDWQEVGMSVKASQQWAKTRHAPNGHQSELSNGLRSSEGAMVFERILANKFPRVVVSTQDVACMMIERVGSKLLGLRETPQEAHQRPALSSDYAAPRNELEQQVVDIWQNLLGINPIGIYDNFFEMGGHSLLATQVISRLRETLHVELPLRSLFEANTVAELAKYIETILATFQDLEVVPDVIQDGREGVEL